MTSCKDCADRAIGCHTCCERYRTYRAGIDARIEMNRIESVSKGYVSIREARVRRAMMKRRGKL
jgi:hypothetical protein